MHQIIRATILKVAINVVLFILWLSINQSSFLKHVVNFDLKLIIVHQQQLIDFNLFPGMEETYLSKSSLLGHN